MNELELSAYFESLYTQAPKEKPADFDTHFESFLKGLEEGSIRSASKKDGDWSVHLWVKKSILLGFKYGVNREFGVNNELQFFDKSTYPTQTLLGVERNIRVVPGGSSVRRGSFVGNNVTMMPPMYINTGAFVDDGTMIDSHALVGSCAQIGKRVHLSAAAQIGGVLEPIGARPVIIEDDCLIGGNTGIYEGTLVGEGSVIGAGVILTRSTPVFDLVNETVYKSTDDVPLVIPPNAVVVPGSRPIIRHPFAHKNGLSVATPIIIKYRDSKTDASTSLEELLR